MAHTVIFVHANETVTIPAGTPISSGAQVHDNITVRAMVVSNASGTLAAPVTVNTEQRFYPIELT